MEPSLGLRVVRGPDWRWEDQDGGEGCVGTVVELGREKKAVMVQWDCGIRALYRSGAEDKFDLRVLDTAPTGLKFPEVVCSGCYAEGVAGTYWKCAHCYEYHLCHSCYLLGRHCQEHPFFRIQSTKQTPRVKYMSPRVDARQVEAKGIFLGAEVVRGTNWKFGNQDGGAGSVGRVTGVEGWKDLSARSVAKVEWSASGKSNIYRVGHRGKVPQVDLQCVSVGSGGHYYPEHLCTLGSGAPVTFFNEDEIVAGDLIVVELDLEVFRMIHEVGHMWTTEMPQLIGQSGIVVAVLEHQRLRIFFQGMMTVSYNSVTKLKHCRKGEIVQVINDASDLYLRQYQNDYDLWSDELVMTLGQIGQVTEIHRNGIVQVNVQGRGWLFDPRCLLPAPGETAPATLDPQSENLGMLMVASRKRFRDMMKEQGFTNEALLDGDLKALSYFLYSNMTEQVLKDGLLRYYAVTGMIPALKMVLESGIGPNITWRHRSESGALTSICIKLSQEKSCLALLDAGADVNSKEDAGMGRTLATMVSSLGGFCLLKAIATNPRVILNTHDGKGQTALNHAAGVSNHLNVAVLLAAGISPAVCVDDPVCGCGSSGLISVMEVFVAHEKGHLNQVDDDEMAPIHYATLTNHSRVCSLLAAQDCVDINLKGKHGVTPLYIAADRAYWTVVECLVGWGAALNITAVGGVTPLHVISSARNPRTPESPQLKQVYEELSRASGGRAVEGYVAVACFLVQEGADFHAKSNAGISPYQVLPPEIASLITAYVKNHPGSFHGSLRSTQQQRKLCELPQRLKLMGVSNSVLTSGITSPGSEQLANLKHGMIEKNVILGKTTSDKATPAVKQQAPTGSPMADSPQPQIDSGASGRQEQLCLLCEEHPASVQFSPCGHTVMCSGCAERAKRCLQCRHAVEAMKHVQ